MREIDEKSERYGEELSLIFFNRGNMNKKNVERAIGYYRKVILQTDRKDSDRIEYT